MIIAIDTNVLIPWLVAGVPNHGVVRPWVEERVLSGDRLALVPQVCWEFVHVITDERRFESPLSPAAARALMLDVWNAKDVERVTARPNVVSRTFELMDAHALGRKRVLDTALAATLEAANIRRLATFNASDFACFDFLEIITPA